MSLNALNPKLKSAVVNPLAQKMQPATYDLKAGQNTSNAYTVQIAAFADHWTAGLHPDLDSWINPLLVYRIQKGLSRRSFEELSLEMLALGVALHEHAARAMALPGWAARLLKGLIACQERWPRFEQGFKNLRGLVNGLFDPFRTNPVSASRASGLTASPDTEFSFRWRQRCCC